MIALDTNVISEMMRLEPNPAVAAWIAAQPNATLCTTSVNKAEILYGIAALPEGRRRAALLVAAESVFTEDLADRVLAFDGAAAARYGEIITTRIRAGKPIEAFDALIAATALVAGADVATRDISDFQGLGLALIDPWCAS
jgi:predicted nucleic acid-binding protein